MYHKDRESRCLYYLGRYNSKIVMTMLLVKSRNEHPEDIAHPSHTAFFYHSRGRKSFLLSGESPFQVDRKKSQNSIVHFPISPVKTVRNSQYHRKNPLISIYCFKYLPNLLSHIRQIIILQRTAYFFIYKEIFLLKCGQICENPQNYLHSLQFTVILIFFLCLGSQTEIFGEAPSVPKSELKSYIFVHTVLYINKYYEYCP